VDIDIFRRNDPDSTGMSRGFIAVRVNNWIKGSDGAGKNEAGMERSGEKGIGEAEMLEFAEKLCDF